ncbi:MAG: cheD [Proteobacteria bacterium]|nr:cheD [Pseudomonadota bacterium]
MEDATLQHLSPVIYMDRSFDMEAAKIKPGEYFVTTRDMVIVTVLGSCVSACIRDGKTGIGGMNHFMLPDSDGSDPLSASARYGAYAMEVLINHLLKLGAARERLEAKTFGGGRVLHGFTTSNIGEQNAEFVTRYLDREGIRIVASDLLDIYPRKIYFFPKTGKVLVRQLRSVHNNTIVDREREYEYQLHASRIDGEVEIFR